MTFCQFGPADSRSALPRSGCGRARRRESLHPTALPNAVQQRSTHIPVTMTDHVTHGQRHSETATHETSDRTAQAGPNAARHGPLGSHLMASMRGDSRRGDSGLPLCHRSGLPPPSVASRVPTEIWAGRLGSSSTDSGCANRGSFSGGGVDRSRALHRNGELGRVTSAGALCSLAAMGEMGGDDDAGKDALCCAFAAGWLGASSSLPSSGSSPLPGLPGVMASVRHGEQLVSSWVEGVG